MVSVIFKIDQLLAVFETFNQTIMHTLDDDAVNKDNQKAYSGTTGTAAAQLMAKTTNSLLGLGIYENKDKQSLHWSMSMEPISHRMQLLAIINMYTKSKSIGAIIRLIERSCVEIPMTRDLLKFQRKHQSINIKDLNSTLNWECYSQEYNARLKEFTMVGNNNSKGAICYISNYISMC